MAGLRPSLLNDLGLGEALSELLQEQTSGLGIELRHSGSERIEVRLSSDGTEVCLKVADQRVGFDPDAVNGLSAGEHFGLASMRERAELLGGWLKVRSVPEQGTVVTARIPL